MVGLNPHISLPSQQITVVHRSDGSGTTYILSNYLSHVAPAWGAKVGTGTTLHWPAGIGEEGNPGVAEAVAHIQLTLHALSPPGHGARGCGGSCRTVR